MFGGRPIQTAPPPPGSCHCCRGLCQRRPQPKRGAADAGRGAPPLAVGERPAEPRAGGGARAAAGQHDAQARPGSGSGHGLFAPRRHRCAVLFGQHRVARTRTRTHPPDMQHKGFVLKWKAIRRHANPIRVSFIAQFRCRHVFALHSSSMTSAVRLRANDWVEWLLNPPDFISKNPRQS